MRPDWRVDDRHLLTHVYFSKHPRSLRSGDLLVYYATRHGVLPAIAELASDEPEPNTDERFKWMMAVRPVVAVGLREAPSLADATIDSLRVRRQSHILLTPREFQLAHDLLLDTAAASLVGVVEGSSPRDPGVA